MGDAERGTYCQEPELSHRIDPRIQLLMQGLDSAYRARGWHGPVLRNVLKGIPFDVAQSHQVTGRLSIWELALHTAYWKYTVRRRITGDSGLTFPRPRANFPQIPAHPSPAEWASDLRLLDQEHELLRQAVLAFPPARLGRKRPKARWTYAEEIQGAAAHDLYHAGQAMLLRRVAGL